MLLMSEIKGHSFIHFVFELFIVFIQPGLFIYLLNVTECERQCSKEKQGGVTISNIFVTNAPQIGDC